MLSASCRDEWGFTSPVNWRIRNTFLDMPLVAFTPMQGFQRSRRAWSCPAGGREAAEREEVAIVSETTPTESAGPPSPRGRATLPTACQLDTPRPLVLAELLGPQSHSKGSVSHYQGACKPCAFFWKVIGCKYGSACEFCHLCDADERKRRNKEKRLAMHALQVGDRTLGSGPLSRHSRGGRP